MKVNIRQNLALKLGPNENYFTEELVGIVNLVSYQLNSSCSRPNLHWDFMLSFKDLAEGKKNELDFLALAMENRSQTSFSLN